MVSREEAQTLASKYNCIYFETSAKEDMGVELAIQKLVKEVTIQVE